MGRKKEVFEVFLVLCFSYIKANKIAFFPLNILLSDSGIYHIVSAGIAEGTLIYILPLYQSVYMVTQNLESSALCKISQTVQHRPQL